MVVTKRQDDAPGEDHTTERNYVINWPTVLPRSALVLMVTGLSCVCSISTTLAWHLHQEKYERLYKDDQHRTEINDIKEKLANQGAHLRLLEGAFDDLSSIKRTAEDINKRMERMEARLADEARRKKNGGGYGL